MANSNYWLSALNTPKSNTPQKLNPFAGASLPKTGNNAFTNFQFQQLVNNVAAKNTTAKPADNIVAPSGTKTLGQQQQEVNQIKPASTPSAMNFDANQLQGLNSAYSRQQGGTANADDIKNLEYATARGFNPTTPSISAPSAPTPLSSTPIPIQTPTTAPTSPTVAKTSDDAYKEAARAYIASLAPSSDVNSAKQKYADFITSANLGNEALQGQGRGIPLGLVRGQQEKLYNQSQIEAERLQGDVNLATGSQEAQQAQALAGMNLESTLLGQGREQEQSVIDFNNKMLMSGYQPYTGQPGKSATNVQTFIDPNGQERQYIAPTEKTEYKTATAGSTIYDPNTGQPLYTIPSEENDISTNDYENWLLAGGELGTGKSFADFIAKDDGISIGDNISGITGKPLTEIERLSQTYAKRLEESSKIIDGLESKFTGTLSGVASWLPQAMKGEDRKLIEQAQRNFVNAVLRKESGAAISDGEFKNAEKQYFPQAGDTEAVLAQKKANRQTVIDGMKKSGGINDDPLGLGFNLGGTGLNDGANVKLGSRLAQVNNNPGNLRYVGQQGASQGEGGFAKFSSPQAGYNALKNQIKLDASRGLTVSQFINKYAPPVENNTSLYVNQFASALGVNPNVKLSSLDINKVTAFMAKKESSSYLV